MRIHTGFWSVRKPSRLPLSWLTLYNTYHKTFSRNEDLRGGREGILLIIFNSESLYCRIASWRRFDVLISYHLMIDKTHADIFELFSQSWSARRRLGQVAISSIWNRISPFKRGLQGIFLACLSYPIADKGGDWFTFFPVKKRLYHTLSTDLLT